MAIRAVVFDIGGVLERVDSEEVLSGKWRRLLGMSPEQYQAARAAVDPGLDVGVGGMTEAEFSARYAAALGLTPAQQQEFMADLWDWYCGELDQEMMAFAQSLRPAYVTAILSNSADGARREEIARYAFDQFFDPILYSHEIGLQKPDPAVFALTCERVGAAPAEVVFIDDTPQIVEAARDFGIHAVCNVSTPDTIARVCELITF